VPVDTSMYQRNPLKSVADYETELYQPDILRNRLALGRQELQMGQQKMQENASVMQDKARARQEAEVLRQALVSVGPNATTEQRIAAMEGTGLSSGYAGADMLRKAMLDKRKVEAQALKDEEDARQTQLKTTREKYAFGKAKLANAASPQDAIQAANEGVMLGHWGMNEAKSIIDQVQKEPNFEAYKLRELQSLATADQRLAAHDRSAALEQTKVRDAETARGHDLTAATARRGQDITREAALGGGSVQIGPDGQMFVVPTRGATGKPIVGSPVVDATGAPIIKPSKADQKPLPQSVVKDIAEARDNAATLATLASTFKKDFGSKGVLGVGSNLQLAAGGVLGKDKDAVDWWKNYRKQAELIERHALFGAALTPTEQASWRSADIGPEMHPDVIQRNLKAREALSRKMADFKRQDMIDAGHNADRVNAIAGRAAPEAGKKFTYLGPE
jgi:hypothetical protein